MLTKEWTLNRFVLSVILIRIRRDFFNVEIIDSVKKAKHLLQSDKWITRYKTENCSNSLIKQITIMIKWTKYSRITSE